MFRFLLENELIAPHKSAIIPGDFCISQLLSIIPEIYKSFHDLRLFPLDETDLIAVRGELSRASQLQHQVNRSQL